MRMVPLHGLVLAGGASRRMGRDKGTLEYRGEPRVLSAFRLLAETCERAFVSVDAAKAETPPYSALPTIIDEGRHRGPIAGLEAAWARYPFAAWLLLAVDLPLVDRELLEELVAARDTTSFATAFRHADGTPEPLCTIWEPAAREPLLAQLHAGDASLRRFLERCGFAEVRPGGSSPKLRSVDDPDSYAEVAARGAESL